MNGEQLKYQKKRFHILEYHRQYWNEELIKYMPYRSGLHVLDLRCGKGLMLEQLLGRTASAWGVDWKLPPTKKSRAPGQVSIAEHERLPFPSGSFDVVFGYRMLSPEPHLEHTLKELSRVLRPSGRLILWESRRLLRQTVPGDLGRWMHKSSLLPVLREPFDCIAYPLVMSIGHVPLLANADLTQAIAKAAFALDGLFLRVSALHDKSWHVIIVAEKGELS